MVLLGIFYCKMALPVQPKAVSPGQELYHSIEEQPNPIDAEIVGSVPKWIAGALVRVGPGKFEWGDSKYNHWFDGEAILNRFEIKDGNVKFSSRFLRSNSYVESEKRGCIAFSQFGTLAPPDPCKNIFSRHFSYYFSMPEMTDNCNVNVVKLKDDYYASTETPRMWRIDDKSLESLQLNDISNVLPGPRSWLAHPHYDDDGAYYNCSTAFINKVHEIVKIPAVKSKEESANEGLQVLARIPYKSAPGYYHSFSMTENYFVVFESSLYFSNPLKLLLMKVMNWSYFDLLNFDAESKSSLHVVDRRSNKLAATFKVDAFMCFHQINAYETSDDVIVFDMCGYSDAVVMQALRMSDMRGEVQRSVPVAELRRYRLPMDKLNTEAPPCEAGLLHRYEDGNEYEVLYTGIELPRINYNYHNGKDYTYVYGMGAIDKWQGLTRLIKVNVKTREHCIWEEENCHVSEPVFIPRPNPEREDDGIVLSSVCGVRGQRSFLLLLDGMTFKEVARGYVSKLIPLIHGEFVN